MKRKEKEEFVEGLRTRLGSAPGAFLVDYQGLDVESMNRLRRELRNTGAEFQVVKNRLLRLACQGTDTESIQDSMVGPSALTLLGEDVVAPAKVLVDLAKEYKALKIKAGQVSGKGIGPDEIKKLAELPGRDALLAQALSAMQGVPASFVRVLNGVLVQFLNVVKAIEAKKGEAGA